ncbi:hypothetical protein ETI06_00455 [Macrococcoides goetzii]|nr:hypothetical protein [Macrococcus goetzii]TDM50481.1 hypothetical protein ETI06_00455 [Macrococcus goetzii]
MKKLLLLSMTAMLMAACGNEEETKEKGASKVETETSASTAEKKEVSTEEKAKETKKVVEKKDATEEKSLSGKYPYMDEDGHIDILSDAFINAYTRQNRISEFAGITQGMEVTEVEKIYGKPTHDGKSRISSDHERFGDIAIENTDYKVSQIYINSSTPHTREEILSKYGVATEVWKSDDGEVISLVYNNNHSNGFQLILHFDKNDNFIAMEQQPETYQMTGELIVSDDDAPSEAEMAANSAQGEVTKDQLKQYIEIIGEPNEAEKSGTGIHSIEDQDDKWLIHTYHLSMAGASPDYIVDKKTGDVISRYPMTGDEDSAPNLFQTIK